LEVSDAGSVDRAMSFLFSSRRSVFSFKFQPDGEKNVHNPQTDPYEQIQPRSICENGISN